MYEKVSIGKLSSPQVSKLLNGHTVRISHGDAHEVHLSKEQLKKFKKARDANKGLNLTFDPYQIDHHKHLKGKGWADSLLRIAAPAVIDAGSRLLKDKISGASLMEGNGMVARGRKGKGWGSNLLKAGLKIAAPIVIDEGSRLLKDKISGSALFQAGTGPNLRSAARVKRGRGPRVAPRARRGRGPIGDILGSMLPF